MLADGQEPLALLAAELAESDQTGISTEELLNTFDDLERKGYVAVTYVSLEWRMGMPAGRPSPSERAAARDLVVRRSASGNRDSANVGLFYELTDSGYQLLRELSPEPEVNDLWRVEFRPVNQQLIIEAIDDNVAASALQQWSDSNPEYYVAVESGLHERGIEFARHDGAIVTSAVRWLLRPIRRILESPAEHGDM